MQYQYSRDTESGTLYWVVDIGSAHFGWTYNVNATLDTMSSSYFSNSVFVSYNSGKFPEEWILESAICFEKIQERYIVTFAQLSGIIIQLKNLMKRK